MVMDAHVTFKELRAWQENDGTVGSPGLGGIHRPMGTHLGEGFMEELRLAWRPDGVSLGRDVRGETPEG